MTLPFLLSVKDYDDMLKKISSYTFLTIVVCIFILTYYIPEIKIFFEKYPFDFSLSGFKIPIQNFIIAIFITSLFRAIILHDKISDLFRIRYRYDIKYILIPLKDKLGLNKLDIDMIKKNRNNLMSQTFYAYASSTNQKIDSHLINRTLEQWSWYWIVIESMAILFFTILIFFYFGHIKGYLILSLIWVIMLLSTFLLKHLCKRYTQREIDAILELPNSHKEIREKFNAL